MCVIEYRQQSDAVQHTLEVKNSLAQLLSTLQDAETGQRGFLLTGDDAFLQPYVRGAAITRNHIAEVRNLTGDMRPSSEASNASKNSFRASLQS